MTKVQAQTKFPVGTEVSIKKTWRGRVSGYSTYKVAFIGVRTFIKIDTLNGRPFGEWDPADVTVVV